MRLIPADSRPVLQDRIGRGLRRFRAEFPQHQGTPALVVAGGVAANKALRQTLQALCDQHGFQFIAPPLHFAPTMRQ